MEKLGFDFSIENSRFSWPMSHTLLFGSLEELVLACRMEMGQTWEEEVGYCFELFRLALEEKNRDAWEVVQQEYVCWVKQWIREGGRYSLNEQEVEELAQEAFIKFWCALNKKSEPLGEQFEHVGVVLSYLRQCAITAVFDHHRRQQRQHRLEQKLLHTVEPGGGGCLEHIIHWEQINLVRQWVRLHITDFCERLVIRLSFEQDFSPMQIAACYPQHFATPQDVYRVKERVLKRAKRSLLK